MSFNKAGNEATGWDFLTLKPSYKCVIDHGGAIGVGFRGEDQKTLAQGNADNDTIYNDVSDPFDVATTQTAFSGTGSKKLADVDDSTEASVESSTSASFFEPVPENAVCVVATSNGSETSL